MREIAQQAKAYPKTFWKYAQSKTKTKVFLIYIKMLATNNLTLQVNDDY